jgi:hypothetical protein
LLVATCVKLLDIRVLSVPAHTATEVDGRGAPIVREIRQTSQQKVAGAAQAQSTHSVLARTDAAVQERKFFDSGDYAMYKAGKGGQSGVGQGIPSPDLIPHSNPTPNNQPHHPHQMTSIQPGAGDAPAPAKKD